MKAKCEWCSTVFDPQPLRSQDYCSRTCEEKAAAHFQHEDSNPNPEPPRMVPLRQLKACEWCGTEELMLIARRQKYCTTACKHKAESFRARMARRAAKCATELGPAFLPWSTCETCGRDVRQVDPRTGGKSKRHFCSYECHAIAVGGGAGPGRRSRDLLRRHEGKGRVCQACGTRDGFYTGGAMWASGGVYCASCARQRTRKPPCPACDGPKPAGAEKCPRCEDEIDDETEYERLERLAREARGGR